MGKDGTEYVKPLGYEFECPTRYDRLFSGLVIPKAAWATTIPGAGVIGPEHVYYRAEDGGVDFGEVLRRAMVDREINRTRVASPTGFDTHWTVNSRRILKVA